ncbi:MAG TPA: hypothetical protein VI636_23410 [Candidatus Angelobacter sp.]
MPSSLTLLMIGCFASQLLLLGVMIKRGLHSELPAFFNFLLWNTAATVIFQVALRWFFSQYGYVYWSVAAVSMLLSFWIFYEVFVTILKPYSALIDLGKMLFRWAAMFLLVGSLVTALSTKGTQFNKICAVILLLEQCIQLMQCGMVLLLLAFESRLGLSWRNHAMAVGIGVGSFAACDLTIAYLGQHFPAAQPTFDVANTFVSIALYAFWTIALLSRQSQRKTVLDSPSRLIFQRWNEALMATPLVTRKSQVAFAPVESFLPGVEQTVERVMARKMLH